MTNKLQIVVGKKYKNRRGEIVYITHTRKRHYFFIPYYIYFGNIRGFDHDDVFSSGTLKYNVNGSYREQNVSESVRDLVEELILPEDTPTGKILYK